MNDINITALSKLPPEVQEAIVWNDTITIVTVFIIVPLLIMATFWTMHKSSK